MATRSIKDVVRCKKEAGTEKSKRIVHKKKPEWNVSTRTLRARRHAHAQSGAQATDAHDRNYVHLGEKQPVPSARGFGNVRVGLWNWRFSFLYVSVRICVRYAEQVAAKKAKVFADKENLGANGAPLVNFGKVAKSLQRQGEPARALLERITTLRLYPRNSQMAKPDCYFLVRKRDAGLDSAIIKSNTKVA
eukprot:1181541-Prorocentrum_minimum.AAC.2